MASLSSKGKFITFEGGEGAGKTSQSKRFVDWLAQRGIKALWTREPGGPPGSELLRSFLLHSGIEWEKPAETFLHFAARAEHIGKTIRPALEAGTWVVCDRFVDSTVAYQGAGQGADGHMIGTLAGLLGIEPDLTVVLDITHQDAAPRLADRGQQADRYEAQDPAFHERVHGAFRFIALTHPKRCVLVQAGGTKDEVHQAVVLAVAKRFGLPLSPDAEAKNKQTAYEAERRSYTAAIPVATSREPEVTP